MDLKVLRKIKSDTSTIGQLFVDGALECFTLEDRDRDLVQTQTAADIAKIKIHSRTAIPKGKYEVILNYSNRFKKFMPLLLDVPGFAGVRIHAGNKAEDTEGCILLGSSRGENWIGQSRDAVAAFMDKLEVAIKTEKVFITIE